MEEHALNDRNELRDGLAAGVLAYILWGLLTIYWKTLHGFPPFELIGWRIVSSFLILGAFALLNGRGRAIARAAFSRALAPRIAAAAVLVTVNWSSYVWAVAHDHVIETALGYFMAPLLTMWLGVAVLKEKLNTAQRTTIGLAGVAIVILTAGYGRVPFLALLIAASWALYGLLKRQVPMSSLDSLTAEMMWLVAPAIGLAVAQSSRTDSVTTTSDGLHLTLVVLTGLITVVPLWMFGFAAKRVPLTVLGPLQYSVPTINFLLGWLAYNENLDTTKLVGFGFVWVALVVLGVDTY
ncbi:MAG: EamA family transporter RarD, partial [Actinomycetota bacterium]